MRTSWLTAEPPWHRVEQGAPEAGRVPLLTALNPALGWPGWLLRVPMRWLGGDRYERLDGPLQIEPFVPPAAGQPGEPWRFSLSVADFPAPGAAAAWTSPGRAGTAEADPLRERASACPSALASTSTFTPTLAPAPAPWHGPAPGAAAMAGSAPSQALWTAGAPVPGLLLLGLYLEPRALSLVTRRATLHAVKGEELLTQVEPALAELLALPPHRWWTGFVALPQAGDGASGIAGIDANPSADEPTADPGAHPTVDLCFALAACQYPPGLLDVSPGSETDPHQSSPALASLTRLHHFARSTPLGRASSLLLLAGDQIYADASGGLADSRSGIERYARAYREFKAGPVRHLPPSLARIVHSVDDHEIVDNWEPCHPADHGPWFEAARQAAWDYRWEAGARVGGPHCLWHRFDWRGAAFFVLDARCERQLRRVDNWARARLWSTAQRDAFADWLASGHGRPRFVLSGSLPLPRRRSTQEHAASCLRSDAWDGFPHSQHELLGLLWAQRAEGLVFLSGDEHRSGWVHAQIESLDEPSRAPVRLHSVHSSALYAPWPFAVTGVEELATPDVFDFPGPNGERLRCTVSDWTDHAGDGFAVIRLQGDQLSVWFNRAGRGMEEPQGAWRL